MPLKYRPYYPRRYAQPQQQGGGGFGSGWQIGSEIGKGLGGLATALKGGIEQSKMDAVANQLMAGQAAQNLPRAQSLGRLPTDTGEPQDFTLPDVTSGAGTVDRSGGFGTTVGNLIPTGGLAELKLRQGFEKEQLANQIDRAKLAGQLNKQRWQEEAARRGGGVVGGRSPWGQQGRPGASQFIQSQQGGGQGGKAKKYAPGSSTPDDPEYYNYNNQRADVDSRFGKGTFDKLQALQGVITQDPKTGKWTSSDETIAKVNADTGDVTLLGKGGAPQAHISADDLTANMKRYDATTVQKGGKPQYIGQYMKSQAPETGKDAGTVENPFLPQDRVDLNAIPPGGYFVNPSDGKVHQKQPSQGGGQKTADTSATADTSTATTDTGDSDLEDQSYDEGDTTTTSQINARDRGQLASNAPPAATPDFGQGDQAGRPLDPMLAEALRRKQVEQSLIA